LTLRERFGEEELEQLTDVLFTFFTVANLEQWLENILKRASS